MLYHFFNMSMNLCGDLIVNKASLSNDTCPFITYNFLGALSLVENIGVEPMTSCVQGRRSSQLS